MNKLTIYEEDTNLLWGLIVVVSTAAATYLLGDAFVDDNFFIIGFRQVSALLLLVVASIGVLRIADPLYRFELHAEGDMLTIEVYKGDKPVKNFYYNLKEFEELQFAAHDPDSKDQALFDFSPTYHLVYKSHITGQYGKLIDLGNVTFTLKVPDISHIIHFICQHNPSIRIPEEQKMIL